MDITLKLVGWTRSKHNLTLLYRFHEVTFSTTIWYSTVDLHRLEAEYGSEFMHKLYFHILLFHGLKLTSLKPTRLDLGQFAEFWTPQLARLWDRSIAQCLGQWRYETKNLDYRGPRVDADPAVVTQEARRLEPGDVPVLLGNGGGKDTLLMMRLLEVNKVSFDTFTINFHTHANPGEQMALNEQILHRLPTLPRRNHRQYIMESFLNSPAAELHGVDGLYISCIRNDEDLPLAHGLLGLLPVVLQHRYTILCFGNERSAESENVQVAGERINHAWSKTTECEVLYEEYIRREFVENLSFISFLKPCSDVLIYRLLERHAAEGDLRLLYSCNAAPPWCRSCPKCAYVWLCYLAYLRPIHEDELRAIFGDENPFDRPQLLGHYLRLMGLHEHKPFECVGEIDEARLAFEHCVRAGLTGVALDHYRRHARLDPSRYDALWAHYNRLDETYRRLPERFAQIIRGACRDLDDRPFEPTPPSA